MGTVAGFVQLVNGTAADYFFAELDKRGNDVLKVHHHRTAAVDCQHIHTEAGLQRRIFIELI